MTLDEFETTIDTIGRELQNLTPQLTAIANQLEQELKAAAPVAEEGGGALKSSISVDVSPTAFAIEMLDYGAYQNYGVKGTKNNTQQKEVEVGLPNAGNEYQFGSQTIGGDLPFGVRKSIAERGLNAKGWFSIAELTTEVTERLQEQINNMIQ